MSDRKIDPIQEGFDPDFAENGVAFDFVPGSSPLTIVGIRANGEILLVGSVNSEGTQKFLLAQLRKDGSPDRDFGINGIVTGSFRDKTSLSVVGAHLLQEGKILLIGDRIGGASQLAFARFLADGSPDRNYGDNGVVFPSPYSLDETEPSGTPENMSNTPTSKTAIGPNGEIIMKNGPGFDFNIRVYSRDGQPVSKFRIYPSFGNALGVSTTGFITVVGMDAARYGNIARYDMTGTLDSSFREGGSFRYKVGEGETSLNALLLHDDGSFFIAGHMDPATDGSQTRARGILAAFNRDGTPNQAFNRGEPVISEFPSGQTCRWHAIAETPDHKLVVAGSTGLPGSERSLIARYTMQGELDTSFGDNGNGYRVTAIGSTREQWLSVLVQPDHKPIASGDCTYRGSQATVVRYRE